MKTDSAIARIKWLLHAAAIRLTGGRPMTWVQSLFVNQVTGDLVSEYRDQLGRRWMATGPWDEFRVPMPGEAAPALELLRRRVSRCGSFVAASELRAAMGIDTSAGGP